MHHQAISRGARTASFFLALLLGALCTGCRSRTGTSSVPSGSATPPALSSVLPSASPSAPPSASAAPFSDAPAGSLSLEDVYNGVKTAYGDAYTPQKRMDAAELQAVFGIGSDLYDDFLVESDAPNGSADTLVLIRAKESKEEEVRQKLEDYRRSLLDSSEQSTPREKIEASRVETEGPYVFYVMLGKEDDTLSGEGLLEALQKEIDKGIDAIRQFFADPM